MEIRQLHRKDITIVTNWSTGSDHFQTRLELVLDQKRHKPWTRDQMQLNKPPLSQPQKSMNVTHPLQLMYVVTLAKP